MYNVTHKYLPNKRSSLLLLHSRIPLIECASEYSESLYSRIHIRIRHPVFAIRIVFVTWCIRSSPNICPLCLNELASRGMVAATASSRLSSCTFTHSQIILAIKLDPSMQQQTVLVKKSANLFPKFR